MSPKHTHLSPEQCLAISEQLIKANEKQQALQLLLQNFNQTPSHPQLALSLARLLHQHGQNREAITILNKAYSLGSKQADLLYMFAALLHLEKHFRDAEKIIHEYLSLKPDTAEAYNLLGANHIELNQYEPAVAAYLSSIKLKPNTADAYNNLAWAYRAMGKTQEALNYFEQAFKIDPTAIEALSGLLLLKTFTNRTKEFDIVESCLNRGELSTKQQIELEFALGKAYEDIKDYKIAFTYFKRANDRWRKNLSYDIKNDQALFVELKKLVSDTTLSNTALRNTDPGKTANQLAQPIFVLGMPRSSTTLIEQILSAHSKVIGGGELPFLENLLLDNEKQLKWTSEQLRNNLTQLSNSYLDSVRQHISNEASSEIIYFTDKLPQNFRFIGAILALFPNAKIIHCKRDAMDTCLSLYKHHFPMANHGYAYNLKELGQYYNLYEDLMNHWHNIAPQQVFDIQYEVLLEDFEHQVKAMLSFCDLDFEDSCLAFQNNKRIVRTASSEQVRQGLYKNASGRWLMYEQELAELKASLQSYS